jgi:hypothetical protein
MLGVALRRFAAQGNGELLASFARLAVCPRQPHQRSIVNHLAIISRRDHTALGNGTYVRSRFG